MTQTILILATLGEPGGTQTSVYNLAKKLQDSGHTVTVGFGPGTFLRDILDKAHIPFVQFQHLNRSYNLIHNLRFIVELSRYLKHHPQDVLHCNSSNTLFGALAAKMQKKQILTVFTFRGLSLLDKNYPGSSLKKWIYKKIFQLLLLPIDKKVCVSQENYTQLVEYHMAHNTTVIHNGLEEKHLNFLEKEQAIEALQAHVPISLKERMILGSIGRLSYQKNYEFLIQEWSSIQKQFPNAIGIIIGDGPEQSHYREEIRVRHLQNEIILVGSIDAAHTYLKAFDLFIMPSRYEGLSLVLIEALFAGIPIIASDVNSNKEVIGEAGVTYPLDDAIVFHNKLKHFVSQTERNRYSILTKKQSQKFRIETTAQKYAHLYSSTRSSIKDSHQY